MSILTRKIRYQIVWRWHFFAGLYVLPFMLILALTGLVMLLYKPVIEPTLYGQLTHVEAGKDHLSWEAQREAVQQAYPQANVSQLSLPQSKNQASRFLVDTEGGQTLQVFVNPYTADVLGDYDKNSTLYALADNLHGTLLAGEMGDAFIELSMGFALVLLVTGIYMWWPRLASSALAFFKPENGVSGRRFWKEWHGSLGVWLSVILVFFILTGLSWTGIWGAKIVQPWNSFPSGVWGGAPESDLTHASLNPGVHEEVPWNLEQTPLPMSGSMAGPSGIPDPLPVNLDTVIAYAQDNGMTYFRVNLPKSQTGVFTIMAATMSGDISDATQDRTMHIDQYTGNKLGDIGYADYSLMAKGMAVGIGLHKGLWGSWNLIANIAICLLVVFLCISGVVMWWMRRPKSARVGLNVPTKPDEYSTLSWRSALVMWLAVSVFVPLMLPALLVIIVIEKIWSYQDVQPVLKPK